MGLQSAILNSCILQNSLPLASRTQNTCLIFLFSFRPPLLSVPCPIVLYGEVPPSAPQAHWALSHMQLTGHSALLSPSAGQSPSGNNQGLTT